MSKKCLYCKQVFEQKYKAIRTTKRCKNEGMFCSLSCSARYHGEKRIKERILNAECGFCGKKFHMCLSRINNLKGKLKYCCRAHKDQAQRLNSGVNAARPPHYGNGKFNYREMAFREYNKRCICGFSFEGLLQIHHKDGNRNTNRIQNLEVVCPMCHAIRHMKKTVKGWMRSTNCLTPRECIPELEILLFGKVFTKIDEIGDVSPYCKTLESQTENILI